MFKIDPVKQEAIELAKFKTERIQKVKDITVEIDGMPFDGDEISQNRMARTITALDDGAVIPWVLADNTVIQATRDVLKRALLAAGEAQTKLWVR